MILKILKTFIYFSIGACITLIFVCNDKSKESIVVSPEITPAVTPTPKLNWNDEIRALFPKESAGTMISICLLEHRGVNGKYAIRWEDNGSYSYGWCQVNSIHRPMNMDDYEWQDYLENPKNHALEVRRIYLSQGFEAWIASYLTVKGENAK